MAEGAGDRLFHDHFAQLAHDQEGNEAGDGVAENHGRAGRLDNGCAAQKQAGTDGAAQGDELNMAVFQAALQLIAVLLSFHLKPRVVVIVHLLCACN